MVNYQFKSVKNAALIIAIVCATMASTTKSYAQVFASVQISVQPPELPVYVQPECPVEGYLWTPGYWAYGEGDYYWVPGVWVRPYHVGYLWTPGYWAYDGNYYGWRGGYWGEHVGYYGGVDYGYGYGGEGFYGGRWQGETYQYNTSVVRVNTIVIHNTYVNNNIVNNHEGNRASFNGRGGVTSQPTSNERVAMNEKHAQATSEQQSHQQVAAKDRNQFVAVNKGKPATAAMNKVGGQRFSQ